MRWAQLQLGSLSWHRTDVPPHLVATQELAHIRPSPPHTGAYSLVHAHGLTGQAQARPSTGQKAATRTPWQAASQGEG